MAKIQTFETALNRLETLTKELEGPDISLDDMVSKYEEAVKVAKECLEKLANAEQKIKLLIGDESSSVELKDVDNEFPESEQ